MNKIDNLDELRDKIYSSEQLHKREAIYNLKEYNKITEILSNVRIILYILISILGLFLTYNLVKSLF